VSDRFKQVIERILSNFDFSKTLPTGAKLHESLAEAITVDENHLNVSFDVHFDGNQMRDF